MLNSVAAGLTALLSLFGASSTHAIIQHNANLHGSTSITCVAAAVATRESALDSAITAETASLNDAYIARASALASAYGESGTSTIRAAVKVAWSGFSLSIKTAHQNWKTSQQNAWNQYRITIKSCGAGAADISDQSNASLDVSAGGATN